MKKSSNQSNIKYFIGIDLHSTQFTCCFLSEKQEQFTMIFPVTEVGIKDFIKVSGKKSIAIVEASTGTFEFVDRTKDHLSDIYVANTHKLKLISFVKKKTDKIDAEKLAMFLKMQILGKEELITPVYVPEKTIRQLRSLFSSYKALTRIIVQIKNQIHGIYKQNLNNIPRNRLSAKTKRLSHLEEISIPEITRAQVNILLRQLIQTEENLLEIENQIKLAGSNYYREINILTSMKGISVIMAIAIIADIADIKRFPNAKKLTTYLRSAPSVNKSNEVTRIGRTNKFGRKLSISLISQSVLHFRSAIPYIDKWYTSKGKSKKRGILRMGIMRKIFSQIYHMLSKEEYHYFRNEKNHLTKMTAYTNFLMRNGIQVEAA